MRLLFINKIDYISNELQKYPGYVKHAIMYVKISLGRMGELFENKEVLGYEKS